MAEEKGEIHLVLGKHGERVFYKSAAGIGSFRKPQLGAKACEIAGVKAFAKSVERSLSERARFVLRIRQQRQQRLGEAREIPLADRRLIPPSIPSVPVNRAEDALRVKAVHKRTRPEVDRLTGNGDVVRIHHAVDKAQREPARDEVSLCGNNGLQQREAGIYRPGGLRIMARDGVVREQAEGIDIVARREELKSAHANMAGRHTGEHRTGK